VVLAGRGGWHGWSTRAAWTTCTVLQVCGCLRASGVVQPQRDVRMVFRAERPLCTDYFVFHGDGRYAHISQDRSKPFLTPVDYGRWAEGVNGVLHLTSERRTAPPLGKRTLRRIIHGSGAVLVGEVRPPDIIEPDTSRPGTRPDTTRENPLPSGSFHEMDVHEYEQLRRKGFWKNPRPEPPFPPAPNPRVERSPEIG
jgi:hypothetical protein